ncbi:MAG: hypothetical protein HDQ90_06005 [Desulfovibrio sp.]|nr:hypothetical protein [Desulfovibrio sp.]
MFSALLFIFFCFFGILAALFYLHKRQEQAWQLLRDEHAQLRVLTRALESRLEYLATVCLDPEQARRSGDDATQGGEPRKAASYAPLDDTAAGPSGTDPLLRLSFEEPETPRAPAAGENGHDPALELRFAPGEDDPRR